ncbi:hypothetical protein [Paracoccus saliphilus]|uniref:Uncharacterized protein n=1 Tax=Paracoccus saliphilus TaxID=405559 RepID=A0AA46A7K8_9RHOB|nr:hypothetical protein [Paracoccus saliphilus]SIT15180.1 hypothetical protein SAMN05421772_12543 [Paracoccus saliphilus]
MSSFMFKQEEEQSFVILLETANDTVPDLTGGINHAKLCTEP